MGAGNSTPQTERIDNPSRGVPIEITPSVVTRLETEQRRQNEFCRNEIKSDGQREQSQPQEQQTNHGWSPYDREIFHKKYNEIEEYEFDRTFEKLNSIAGEPVHWVEDIDEEIKDLRKELIKCYRDYPGETLYCSDLAKKYQEFIFREQCRNVLKLNAKQEESIPATMPPPYQHSPPYT